MFPGPAIGTAKTDKMRVPGTITDPWDEKVYVPTN